MDSKTSLAILAKVRAAQVKQAQIVPPANLDLEGSANAIQQASSAGLKQDAWKDVRNLFLLSLGAGVAGRGGVGLFNLMNRNSPKKSKAGPASLTMPYPAQEKLSGAVGDFFGGGDATTKAGIPWYYPAMTMAGLAGIGGGWKGLDSVLESRRKQERENELVQARQGFHDALLSQYANAIPTHSSLITKIKRAADASVMEKVGSELNTVWDRFSEKLSLTMEKGAFDFGNAGGTAAGMAGTYALLSSLMGGAFMYDKIKKRSRSAILDKAMQRRDRREFMQRPTEIFATPKPTMQEPTVQEPEAATGGLSTPRPPL